MFEGLIEGNLGDQMVQAQDACVRCERHSACSRKVVPEYHDVCDVVAVVPPVTEIEGNTGRPFEGTRRGWLDRYANEAHIGAGEIWQTTILKCVGAKPTKQDQETCLEWIKLELDLVEPRVVLLFGPEVWSHFYPEEKGTWQEIVASGTQIRRDCSSKRFSGTDRFYFLTQDPIECISAEEKDLLLKDTRLFSQLFRTSKRMLSEK